MDLYAMFASGQTADSVCPLKAVKPEHVTLFVIRENTEAPTVDACGVLNREPADEIATHEISIP